LRVPPGLAHLAGSREGARWLARLPQITAEAATRWSLDLDLPFLDGSQAWVAPATTAAGERVVVKIQFPHRESEHEAQALRRWDGHGAVRLLDHHEATHSLLLEWCDPGVPLVKADPAEALDVLAGLVVELAVPVLSEFASLSMEAQRWSETTPRSWVAAGRSASDPILADVLRMAEDLAGSARDSVLVHQDVHGGNVLSAGRRPWLAIDPKPLAGELEFAIAPIARSRELGHGRQAVIGRLDHLVSVLGLDRDRAIEWTIVQTMAWAFDGRGILPHHLEVVEWLRSA
jgi:streptomycin 6-kinase